MDLARAQGGEVVDDRAGGARARRGWTTTWWAVFPLSTEISARAGSVSRYLSRKKSPTTATRQSGNRPTISRSRSAFTGPALDDEVIERRDGRRVVAPHIEALAAVSHLANSDREERAIRDLFLPFLEQLSAFPRVLAHRDYHSRNVMVLSPEGTPGHANLRVLDFQDARMGNVFYDLASLLRDSYVTLPEDAVEDLRYAWRHAATAELRGAAGDPGAFDWRFDLAALQRNVKAIGTFGNQAHNRGKRIYLRSIPPTVAHLRENFERNPPMRALAGRLLPILSALAEKAAAESPA